MSVLNVSLSLNYQKTTMVVMITSLVSSLIPWLISYPYFQTNAVLMNKLIFSFQTEQTSHNFVWRYHFLVKLGGIRCAGKVPCDLNISLVISLLRQHACWFVSQIGCLKTAASKPHPPHLHFPNPWASLHSPSVSSLATDCSLFRIVLTTFSTSSGTRKMTKWV